MSSVSSSNKFIKLKEGEGVAGTATLWLGVRSTSDCLDLQLVSEVVVAWWAGGQV